MKLTLKLFASGFFFDTKMMKIKSIYIFLIIILLGTIVLYYPGLSGGLMLDDENSLSKLELIHDSITLDNLRAYFSESTTGSLKRPISVFSFLIDGTNWPIDVFYFKRTNLMIHLINGVLLYCIIFLLFINSKKYKANAIIISLISTVFWLWHPFLVSSVLYVVQRMTLLSATFVLLGFLIYIKGRIKFALTDGNKGLFSMLIATYMMPILAALSKENGILLIFFIPLFDYFIANRFLGFKELPRKIKIILISPSILFILLLAYKMPGFFNAYEYREFTLYERVLTQFRALSKYLYHIFIPQYFTEGVYSDGFVFSKNIFYPLTTVISIIFISALLLTSWLVRKKYPLMSFVIFFYFIGHALESTIIPLEMYYEHRNYLPMIFIFVPLVVYLVQFKTAKPIVFSASIVAISFLLLLLTHLRVDLFADNFKLHLLTATKYPNSARANTMLAKEFEKRGDYNKAFNVLTNASNNNDDLYLKLNLLIIRCTFNKLEKKHLESFYTKLDNQAFQYYDLPAFQSLFYNFVNNKCLIGRNKSEMKKLVYYWETRSYETYSTEKPLTFFFKAELAFLKEEFEKSKTHIEKYIQWKKDYKTLINYINAFLQKQRPDLAKELYEFGVVMYDKQFKNAIDWHNYKKDLENTSIYINHVIKENLKISPNN